MEEETSPIDEIDRKKDIKTKSNRKWFLIGGAVLLITGIILLCYFYLGFLVVSIEQDKVNLSIGNREYSEISRKKYIIIRPNSYYLKVNKEGCSEYNELINIKPLLINRVNVYLPKSYYLNHFQESNELDILSPNKVNNKKMIYFSTQDNSFYYIFIDKKFSVSANQKVKRIQTNNLNLKNKKVLNIKYSPTANQAFIIVGPSNNKEIIWYNFENHSVRQLSRLIVDVDWISDSKATAIYKNSQGKLKIIQINNWEETEITNISAMAYGVSSSRNLSLVSLVGSGSDKLLSVSFTGLGNYLDLPDGLITKISKSLEMNKFIVQIRKDQASKIFIINSEKETQQIEIDPYLDNVVWLDNGYSIVYFTVDQENGIYKLMKYDLVNKQKEELDQFNIAGNSPSKLTVVGKKIIYINNQSLMGVDID